MMKEFALHVLDIAENSVRGEASHITIHIVEDKRENLFAMEIADDGKGIPAEMLKTIKDPFTTTRTHRRVGMGIPFLNDTCLMCGGHLDIQSEVGVGTTVRAEMQYNNIDRPPLGDIASTILNLFASYPQIHFNYVHEYREKDEDELREFSISTDELDEVLEGTPISTPSIYVWVKGFLKDSIRELYHPEEGEEEEEEEGE